MAVRQLKDGRWIVYYRVPDKPKCIRMSYAKASTTEEPDAVCCEPGYVVKSAQVLDIMA